MTRLPLLKSTQLVKVVEKLGFRLMRQRGSHMFYSHPDGRTTIIPNHPGEEIDRGLLNKIMKKDLFMSREDFLRNL